MKKNIKKGPSNKSSNHSYFGGFELPNVVDMDALSYFDDESLDRYHNNLQNDRERVARDGHDALPWEVEICYVQREMKIRSSRRAAHEKYLKTNPDAYYDNMAFEDYDQHAN